MRDVRNPGHVHRQREGRRQGKRLLSPTVTASANHQYLWAPGLWRRAAASGPRLWFPVATRCPLLCLLLQRQIAVVTGGSQSIGKTIVEMLALEGASVYFCSLCEDEGNAVAEAINKQLGLERAFHVRVDVSDREALAAWITSVGEKEGRVDILVPNAAAFVFGTIDEVDDDDWDKVLSVNVKVRLWHTSHGLLCFCGHAVVLHGEGKGKRSSLEGLVDIAGGVRRGTQTA